MGPNFHKEYRQRESSRQVGLDREDKFSPIWDLEGMSCYRIGG